MKFQRIRKIKNPSASGDICSYCHERIEWYQTKCGNCGYVLGQKYIGCEDCGIAHPNTTSTCARCNSGEEVYETIDIPYPAMRYYNFLTYFLLPINAIWLIFLTTIFYQNNVRPILLPYTLFLFILYYILIYNLSRKVRWSWKLLIYLLIFNPPISYLMFIIND